MESSRDSSVWRNLAVTFGGGLALGAVGMKLTQSALRPTELPLRPNLNLNPVTDRLDVTDRLGRMERRLERVEKAPAHAATPAAAPVDQKVLEAVVGAVDARLHEHAGQVERRLADLEARMTVELQALHQQDRHVADTTEKYLADIQHQFREEVADLRAAVQAELSQVGESVSRMVTSQVTAQVDARAMALESSVERHAAATAGQLAEQLAPLRAEVAQANTRAEALEQSVGSRVVTATAAAAAHFEEQLAPLRAEVAQANTRAEALEQSVETRVVTAAAAAEFEGRLAPLRAEVAHKERELEELRHRLTESESAVLDVILAIGQVCRQAAERIGARAAAPPSDAVVTAPVPETPAAAEAVAEVAAPAVMEAPPASSEAPVEAAAPAPETPPIAAEADPAAAPAEPEAVAAAEEASPAGGEPAAEAPTEIASNPAFDPALPGFLQQPERSRPWRIPLVSSFLVTAAGLLLRHYLA
jgi:predicted  nucleic acid-binding Zn-ribbon protein